MILPIRAALFASCLLLLTAGTAAHVVAQPSLNTSAADRANDGSAGEMVNSDDASAKAWAEAQRWYASNDFAQAQSAAGHVTSGPFKKDAQAMLGRIKQYVASLQDGTAAETRGDPVAAIKSYAAAVLIKRDGPGDPAGRIARIQQQAASVASAEKEEQALRAKQVIKRHKEAAHLADKGSAAETAGQLQAAIEAYSAALSLDPANQPAREGVLRLKQQMQGSPEDEARVSAAIRSFYAGHFAEAEAQLEPLSNAAGIRWRGAACFYLGASRLYQALQQGSHTTVDTAFQEAPVHAAFEQARSLGYAPLPQFVSPSVMRLWQGLP